MRHALRASRLAEKNQPQQDSPSQIDEQYFRLAKPSTLRKDSEQGVIESNPRLRVKLDESRFRPMGAFQPSKDQTADQPKPVLSNRSKEAQFRQAYLTAQRPSPPRVQDPNPDSTDTGELVNGLLVVIVIVAIYMGSMTLYDWSMIVPESQSGTVPNSNNYLELLGSNSVSENPGTEFRNRIDRQ